MIRAQLKKRLHGAQGAFELDVTLQVAPGEFIALYGPSGVGKTTLLRCLAGLEQPEQGDLVVNGTHWVDTAKKIHMPPQQRSVGYVFQDYALFPNMTVRGNLQFALRKGADSKRVDALLEMMELGALQHHKPDILSGGQRQRVALARALASEPSLLLLDEPLAALDDAIRSRLQDEILRLHRHFGLTTILVSHDVGEVYKLAHRVLVMQSGRIIRHGSPVEVFSGGQTSGKFCFTGQVLAIAAMDVMASVTVLVGNQIVRVATMPDEAAALKSGDRVMLVSKAFNPMVIKLD